MTDKPKGAPTPKPELLTFDGDGLICDAETGVCTIPGERPVKPKEEN